MTQEARMKMLLKFLHKLHIAASSSFRIESTSTETSSSSDLSSFSRETRQEEQDILFFFVNSWGR
ncbi:hypothetical protein CSUI_009676 [Cystoisospora suis]|uniref:Uncharacterized protein n=1 Tax=Cystoisospora suis TaxID=483139 RepID=A0A2C6KG45_9APIC|nr:hypothetical protein CSUI_009676 [Cystoisospora suis]